MDDDLMPNDGAYFLPREPKDQILARKKEKAKTMEGLAVLKDMIKRFDQRIEFYNTIDSIPMDVRAEADTFLIAFHTNQMVRDTLQDERDYIIGLIETHMKKR